MKKRILSLVLIFTAVVLVIAVFLFENKPGEPAESVDIPDTVSEIVTYAVTDPVTDPPITETEPVTAVPATETEPITETVPPDTEPVTVTPSIDYDGPLPVIRIDSESEIVSKKNYVPCTVTVREGDDEYTAAATVRVRGNSSAYYGREDDIRASGGKVPYKIKFDTKQNLLGLNDGNDFRDWVFLRAGSDAGSIGNDIGLRLGRAIVGSDEYCSDGRFVRLIVNGVDVGPYLLAEQNEVKKKRVNINEPADGDTSLYTGYYMQMENYLAGEISFLNKYASATVTDIEGNTKQFEPTHYSIKSRINDDAQVDFIGGYINDVFRIVYEACENGHYLAFDGDFNLVDSTYTDSESAIRAVLDLDSAVNMYILYEILHDYDVGEGSFYMYVDLTPGDGDGLLHFTSPWDFDWICHGDSTNKYWASTFCDDSFSGKYGERSNPWFIVLYKQDWFRSLVSARWAVLRSSNAIDAALEEEDTVVTMYSHDLGVSKNNTIMKWIRSRIGWLDGEWGYSA